MTQDSQSFAFRGQTLSFEKVALQGGFEVALVLNWVRFGVELKTRAQLDQRKLHSHHTLQLPG
jgi:hypothetical protein